MPDTPLDPLTLVKPRRRIEGITAVLLPYDDSGEVDWPSFDLLLSRTADAGLTPAVNMDTGYVNLLDETTRLAVLERTQRQLGGERFVAGAFVRDQPNDALRLDAYRQRIDEIQSLGGTPVIFQSYGLAHRGEAETIGGYQRIAETCDRFIAFELGQMFAPFGAIYSLDTYAELMAIPQCLGAKHSSLHREPEWRRLALRDRVRPDFRVYTGNDLAIDMVTYGSDYLLGLSCFAPDAFARRDALWAAGDPGWNELNDLLQHLGFLAFRGPVPAYKHSAAMFLHARGWLPGSATHPDSPRRDEADRQLLTQISHQLAECLSAPYLQTTA
ncbi:MAG: dihydrodipicolinate synthase family protein [Planctomycetota bacterium]